MNYIEEYAEITNNQEWANGLILLPPHMIGGMVRYIVHGIPPGSFLSAVVAGDLFEALRRADDVNVHSLPAYARFLINCAPIGCYGAPENVAGWIKSGGLKGMAENGDMT